MAGFCLILFAGEGLSGGGVGSGPGEGWERLGADSAAPLNDENGLN